MRWTDASRFDSEARLIADRHYNRRHVGSPQFVPPGRCLVLKTKGGLVALQLLPADMPEPIEARGVTLGLFT